MSIAVVSRKPSQPTHHTPILFVHGAWHGAWCWEDYFLSYFAENGWNTYALDLTGHGQSGGKLWWTSLLQYVADVAEVAVQIERETGKRPVVIGHSMGGFVTQHYLARHAAPAGVLLASIPVRGFLPGFLRFIRSHPVAALKTLLTMNPYYMINTPSLFKAMCFSDDTPPEIVNKYFPRIQAESFRVALEAMLLMLPPSHKVKTPLLVLGAENDRIFTPHEVRQTAKAYNTKAEFFPDMAHDMMLEKGWRSVADRIIVWLNNQNL